MESPGKTLVPSWCHLGQFFASALLIRGLHLKPYPNVCKAVKLTGRCANWGVNVKKHKLVLDKLECTHDEHVLLLLNQFNYSFPLGNTGQCVFQGITMFDKTVWSPKPCITCLCSSGNVVCDEMQCPVLQCKLKFKPIGQCCPICIDPSE